MVHFYHFLDTSCINLVSTVKLEVGKTLIPTCFLAPLNLIQVDALMHHFLQLLDAG